MLQVSDRRARQPNQSSMRFKLAPTRRSIRVLDDQT